MIKYFQHYGNIERFSLLNNPKYTSGFVCYESVMSAAKAMKRSYCRVNGVSCKVTAADSWHQPNSEEELKQIEAQSSWGKGWSESAKSDEKCSAAADEAKAGCSKDVAPIETVESAPETNLLGLNDDCLVEIFGYLNVIELCAVNQIPGRIHRIAQQVYRMHHTTLDLSHVSSTVNYYELTLHKARNVFQCFGASIVKLKVAALAFKVENRSRVVDLIVRYCPNLKSIEFIDFQFRHGRILHVQNFLGNLHELTLTRCNLHGCLRNLFRNCVQLKSLAIQTDTNLNGACLECEFPQLESATLTMRDDITLQNLHTFLRMNPQLKSLELVHCDDETFATIATALPQLERLSVEVTYFYDFVENLKSLLQLNHLKELKLNCSLYPISSFVDALAAKDTIEVLHISDGVLNDHLIEALSKCKRLQSLKLCSMPNVHDKFLIGLATNLPNLNEFYIRRCQAMTNRGVLAFVEIAKQLNSLSISNSTVQVDDAFFMELVRIYSRRSQKLTLNLLQMNNQLTPPLVAEHKHTVRIERINDFSAFDDDCSNSDINDYCYDFDYDDDDDDIHSDLDEMELFHMMNEMCLDGDSPEYYLW